jgi:guanylate kinase
MSGKKAIIIAAPSGSGKTTIVKYLLRKIPQLKFSISATSRGKRSNEVDKSDYYFLTVDEFKERIKNDAFAEWEEVYNGTLYGTLKSEVNRIWNEGYAIIFDVDVQGAINLKKYFKDQGMSIFIRVRDIRELEARLRLRGTETEKSLQKRIDKAKSEIRFGGHFDKIVFNDTLEFAQKETEQIILTFLNL